VLLSKRSGRRMVVIEEKRWGNREWFTCGASDVRARTTHSIGIEMQVFWWVVQSQMRG